MRLPKEFLERKLSAALNARVTIDALSVSPLAGAIDVAGVTVAPFGPAAEPVLMVRRVKAEVSLGAMLRKEIVIKSVVIEGPTIAAVRRVDGTLNLPTRNGKVAPAIAAAKDELEEDLPAAWKLAAEKVQVLDGAVHYRDGAYHVSAERVVAELLQKPDGVHVTVLAASMGRRDEPHDLGEARAHGVFRTPDITKLPAAPLAMTFEVADAVRGSLNAPSLAGARYDVEVRAGMMLGVLRQLLPEWLQPSVAVEGHADVHVIASIDAAKGIRIKTLSLTAQDVWTRPARDDAATAAASA